MLQRISASDLAPPAALTRLPVFLDLSWLPSGGTRWTSRRTPLFEIALACAHRGMRESGIEPDGEWVLWDLSRAHPEPALSRRVAAWERVTRDEAERRDAREIARRPIAEDERLALQADLAAALSDAWAFRSMSPVARQFVEGRHLTPAQATFARTLLKEAKDRVRAMDASLAEPAGEEHLAAAQDDEVREDLLRAIRHLTELDSDRCRDRNDAGWSAVTTAPGHRLATLDSPTPLQGAHARQLVYPHRRQLPEDLRERLFG